MRKQKGRFTARTHDYEPKNGSPPASHGHGLNPKSQTSKSQRSPSTEISFVIGYWSFFGVWTFAIWDFQRIGYPIAVQKSAVPASELFGLVPTATTE